MDRIHFEAYKLYKKEWYLHSKVLHPISFFKTLRRSYYKKFYDKAEKIMKNGKK